MKYLMHRIRQCPNSIKVGDDMWKFLEGAGYNVPYLRTCVLSLYPILEKVEKNRITGTSEYNYTIIAEFDPTHQATTAFLLKYGHQMTEWK